MTLSIPDVTDRDTMGAALAYAAAGWYVGPLTNGSKHPGSRLGKHWQQATSRDTETIIGWFAGSSDGLFLHCGRSGAVVFDVDHPEKLDGELLAALGNTKPPHQSTRSNHPGRGHYVFTQPPGRSLGNGLGKLPLGWGEIRGRNGVIVVEPTTHENHADGGQYHWTRTGTAPVLPATVADLLADSEPGADAATDAEVRAFLDAHATGDRFDMLDTWVAVFAGKVAAGASRHDSMVSICAGAMAEARAGFYPAKTAMDRLELVFRAAVAQPGHGQQGNPRTPGIALAEWHGIGAWAVAQANAADLEIVKDRAAEKVPDPNWFLQPDAPPANVNPETGEVAVTLEQCHQVFRRWLGDEYDTDALDVMLCAAACERLDGDPLWLLLISGSGNAKTETVQALSGLGAHVISTISSDAALLSGTPKFERSKKSTGGVLRKIGPRGLLVIKDVTSILSTSREIRGAILSALREVHDGRWTREVGTEGGLTLTWEGRLVVVGAVTTAWDQAHDVIATMGDRFVLVRMDSAEKTGRTAARRKAISNTGGEIVMRVELQTAVAGVLAGLRSDLNLAPTYEESERIGVAADLVTLARTAVIYDYRGDVVDAHAPEMPTRFAKQLAQVIRGGIALGMDRGKALQLAVRCARDSLPALRLAIIDDVAANPHSTPREIRQRIDKPRATVDRACQALHMLGVLAVDEVGYGELGKVRWHYLLADEIDPTTLQTGPDLSVQSPIPSEERDLLNQTPPPSTDISGPVGSQNGHPGTEELISDFREREETLRSDPWAQTQTDKSGAGDV